MTIFDELDKIADESNLSFLVIGGHAVNAYGYSRFTKDLDILVCKANREDWINSLTNVGLRLERDGGNFLQMSPGKFNWPLDLMLVPEETFLSMHKDSKLMKLGEHTLRIPSLEHLFALKFHVLKQEIPGRGFKDFMDILSLAQCNAVDLHSDTIRGLCEKYGNVKIYERLLAFRE